MTACAAAVLLPVDGPVLDTVACPAAITCLIQTGYSIYQISQRLGVSYEDVNNAVQNNTNITWQSALSSVAPYPDIYCLPGLNDVTSISQRQPFDFNLPQVDTDAVPVPYPMDKILPNNYKGNFDVALGRAETLSNFAYFFIDQPTVPFLIWPDWMTYDPPGKPGDPPTGKWLQLQGSSDEIIAASVEIALVAWAGEVPNGKIKFNLEGLDRTVPAPRIITLKELKRVTRNPILAVRTHYYFYYAMGGGGVARQLSPPEVAEELTRLAPLM